MFGLVLGAQRLADRRMALTLTAGALSLVVTACLLFDLLRRRAGPEGSSAAIYEDQLAEVDRDEARGLLDPDQAAQARAEVERRLLLAARREDAPTASSDRTGRFVLAAVIGALPVLAAGLYLMTGNPNLPDTDFASRARSLPSIDALEARVASDPGDAPGWVQLGEALSAAQRPAEAARAFEQAVRLTGGRNPGVASAYAEALALEAGYVTPEAEEIFATIKASNPDDPRSTYYLALANVARGDRESAIAELEALLSDADPAAPWYDGLADLLAELTGDDTTRVED